MNYLQALKTLKLSDPPRASDIKKAYRQAALHFHPDRNPDPSALDLFRECTEAYNYLLTHAHEWHFVSTPEGKPQNAPVTDLENIFDDIFGFTRSGRVLGYEEPQNLKLTFVELESGTTKKIKMVSYEKCPACHGLGAKEPSLALICTYCFGAGRIKSGNQKKICPKCGGRGRQMRDRCRACDGFGRLKKNRLQRVSIPAGLKPEEIYTLESEDIKSKTKGEIFVRVHAYEQKSGWFKKLFSLFFDA